MILREFQTALMLLTRLPAGRIAGEAPPLAHAAWAFPLVGALIGLLMWATFAAAAGLGLPPLAAALLALAAQALATGALHEDGLADTADGLGGGATRARKLEIMKDSRIGSYGVLALFFTLGLTTTTMAETASLARFIAIGAASRTAMLLPMAFLRPARSSGLGHGAALAADARFAAALVLTLTVSLPAPGALLPILAVTLALTALMRVQVGGQTGDTLGATQKLAECAGWLAAAALA
jgi:adenosylcobinamide-GDP ribazoletransferase